MILKQNLINPFLTDSFKFMAILNIMDLTEIQMMVEYLHLSARIYIPTKLTESQMKIEGILIELNLRRKRWLLCCSFNPKYSQISYHLQKIGKNLDVLTSKYDNIIIGDFNAEPANTAVSNFCEIYNLKNITREKACFKYPNNPGSIDVLITTNRPKSFQNPMVIETGLSDFHKMCITV